MLQDLALFKLGAPRIGSAEPDDAMAEAPLDDLLEAHKGPAADEQDVRGLHPHVFLLGMLAAALRRHVADGAFENLQQRLLHPFS